MSDYEWKAIYSDGSFLGEYKKDKTPNSYHDIDRTKLAAFELIKDSKPIYRLHLEPGQTLIYRRRVRTDPGGNIIGVFYMIGWQRKIGNENVQVISYVVDSDDHPIVTAGRWDGGEPELTPKEIESFGQ